MSSLRAIVICQKYFGNHVISSQIHLFAPLLNTRRCTLCNMRSTLNYVLSNNGICIKERLSVPLLQILTNMCQVNMICIVFYVTISFYGQGGFGSALEDDIQTVIESLSQKISENQVKRATKEFPPLLWEKDKGVYDSYVKLNFHGSPQMAFMRDSFEIFDNNMFATAWITSCLLEANLYGRATKPKEDDIQISVEAISKDIYCFQIIKYKSIGTLSL